MKARFGQFEFDDESGELRHGTTVVRLQPQPAKLLACLIARPGELITREALQQAVWGHDTNIDFEQGLNWSIRRLREALHDTPSSPGLIETVPRRGYRFVADVTILKPLALVSPAVSSSRWRSRSAIFAAVLVVLAAGIAWAIAVSRRGPIRPAVTVLVLPFDTLSGTTSGESVYGDIASAELTSGLARLDPKRLGVIDPLTARKFKNTKECIIHIGAQLGADYVLLGDVQQSSNTTKIAAQLFKVSTNRQVWATEELIPAASGFSLFWTRMTASIVSGLNASEAANK